MLRPGRPAAADAVFAQRGRYGESNGTFRANLQTMFDGEDGRVIGLHHNIGTPSA